MTTGRINQVVSRAMACFEHSNFFKVTAPEARPGQLRPGAHRRATRGWISVDRGSKATLPLTMPRRVFKSSAKDSARRPLGRELRGGRPRRVGRAGLAGGTGPWGLAPLTWVGAGGGRRRRLLAWILT